MNKWTRTNGFYFICFRPFSVNLIPHTNLIMIVADKTCPCFSTKISIEPTKVEYGPANETAYCERLKYSIYRRKPTHCLNYHAEVSIKGCFFSESMMHFSHCPKNVPKTILKKRFWNCVVFRVSWLYLHCSVFRVGKFKIQSLG